MCPERSVTHLSGKGNKELLAFPLLLSRNDDKTRTKDHVCVTAALDSRRLRPPNARSRTSHSGRPSPATSSRPGPWSFAAARTGLADARTLHAWRKVVKTGNPEIPLLRTAWCHALLVNSHAIGSPRYVKAEHRMFADFSFQH